MKDFIAMIVDKFRTPKDPRPVYFETLKDLREFQRANPGYMGPLLLTLGDSTTEEK